MTEPETPDVFISYVPQDRSYADLLKGYLLARDYKVWSDESLNAGDDWADTITRALEDSRVILLLLSPRYLESKAALYEAGIALAKGRDNKGKVIGIVVNGDDAAREPLPLQRYSVLDARKLSERDLLTRLDTLLTN
jgi:hypothetical protein